MGMDILNQPAFQVGEIADSKLILKVRDIGLFDPDKRRPHIINRKIELIEGDIIEDLGECLLGLG